MSCKLRAREINHTFSMMCGFHAAWTAPGVSLDPNDLGARVQASRNTRNTMQHASAAATVDDRHCADAILDAVDVVVHCWPDALASFPAWVLCGLRAVWLHSSKGDAYKVTDFEVQMHAMAWRIDGRRPRSNETIIEPGRRPFWHLVMSQNPAQVALLLDALGVPATP